MSTQQQPGTLRVLLDTATWFGGWVLIFKQAGIFFAPPGHVSETLVLLGAAMVGVPGIAQVLLARFGGADGTPGSSPAPPSPVSPSQPSSPGEPLPAGENA